MVLRRTHPLNTLTHTHARAHTHAHTHALTHSDTSQRTLATGVCEGASTSWALAATYKYSKGGGNRNRNGSVLIPFSPSPRARNQENNVSGVARVKWGGYCISMATIIIKECCVSVTVPTAIMPTCVYALVHVSVVHTCACMCMWSVYARIYIHGLTHTITHP